VALLPTPNARDGDSRGTPSAEHAARRIADPMRSTNLEDAVAARLLPTPRATDIGTEGRRSSEGWGPQIGQAVHAMLPTPTVTNAHGNGENNRGELLLPGIAVRPETWGRYAEAVALWEWITGVPAPEPTEPGAKGAPRLSPALPEWMMGLRPGLLTGELSRPEALKGAGNGVVPLACAAAWNLLTGPLT
jgi:DNA (cytosine-5)-methyltransferase 1